MLIGIAAVLAAFPYTYIQSHGSWAVPIARDWGESVPPGLVFAFQFSLLTTIALISAFTGSLLHDRYKLPGLGEPREAYRTFIKWGGWAAVAGIFLGWFLHDRFFYAVVPAKTGIYMYPKDIFTSATLVVQTVFTKEVIFRFGLLTLAVGLFRGKHNTLAVILTALFAPALSLRQLLFVDYAFFDFHTVSTLIWSLSLNLLVGFIYVKKGLFSTMTVRMCVDLRYLIYPLLGMI